MEKSVESESRRIIDLQEQLISSLRQQIESKDNIIALKDKIIESIINTLPEDVKQSLHTQYPALLQSNSTLLMHKEG